MENIDDNCLSTKAAISYPGYVIELINFEGGEYAYKCTGKNTHGG